MQIPDKDTQKRLRIEIVGSEWSAKLTCRTFYTWSQGQGLVTLLGHYQQAALNDNTFKAMYNQAVGGNSQCGPGLYISTSMTDSCSYGNGANGILVKVVVPADIRFIDVQNNPCKQKLLKGDPKTNTQDVFNLNIYPKVLVKYMTTWYCMKTTEGVTFGLFDGAGVSAEALKNAYNDPEMMKHPLARAAFLAQLKPDLQAAVQTT